MHKMTLNTSKLAHEKKMQIAKTQINLNLNQKTTVKTRKCSQNLQKLQ